jgi:hypothetical protein
MSDQIWGVATAMRMGEQRILTIEEYRALDAGSADRWEFYSVETDPRTGLPDAEALRRAGWRGGPEERVVPGDLVEVPGGMFRRRTDPPTADAAHDSKDEQANG